MDLAGAPRLCRSIPGARTMDLTTWMLFVAISLATAFSPGPAVMFLVSNALVHGPWRALWGTSGNIAGICIVAMSTAAGLGLLLRTSAMAFMALKVAGALYLVWLGVRQWRIRVALFDRAALPAACRTEARQLFLRGLMVSATNPKAILFFAALLPQFMERGGVGAGRMLLLTATFAACTVVAHLAYALVAGYATRWLSGERRARLVNRLSGTIFVGLGVGLLRLRPAAG